MAITVAAPSVPSLVILGNSSDGTTPTSGFDWCVDRTNFLVYTKLTGPPSGSVAFFELIDDASAHSCSFLLHHWIDGDLIRIYDPGNLTCTLDWTQLPDSIDNITRGTIHVAP